MYAIFLDIDGTLYCDGAIVPANRTVLAHVRALGHKVFLNTARSLADIPEKILSAPLDGVVAGIGCTVLADGQKLRSESIPLAELADIFDRLTQDGCGVFLEGESVLVRNPLFEGHGEQVQNGAELMERFGDKTFAKMFIPHTLSAQWQAELSDKYLFYQHRTYAEFAKKGHNKATGMQCVLDYYGLDRAHCIAMGDSINDLDMLRYAGISVAMGDACEEVKTICTFVSCDARDGGVAQALYKLFAPRDECAPKKTY